MYKVHTLNPRAIPEQGDIVDESSDVGLVEGLILAIQRNHIRRADSIQIIHADIGGADDIDNVPLAYFAIASS